MTYGLEASTIKRKGCMLASEVWIQIEMAAAGCISGTLTEWPLLKQALFECDVTLLDNSSSIFVQCICRDLIKIRDEDRAASIEAAEFMDGVES